MSFSSNIIPKPFSLKYLAFMNWWLSDDETRGMEIKGILQFNSSAKAEEPALVMTKLAKL